MSTAGSASLHFEAKTGGSSSMSKAQARQLERIRVSALNLYACSPHSAIRPQPCTSQWMWTGDETSLPIVSQKDEKIEAQEQLVKK